MNWLEFFFGWLIKGQMEISMLDSIMFILELITVLVIGFSVLEIIGRIKSKRKKVNK